MPASDRREASENDHSLKTRHHEQSVDAVEEYV